jgi:nucleotide-binding universal stress UspA family protein
MKILLAADGSTYTQAAARYLREHLNLFSTRVELHVLHVHPELPYSGRARSALGAEAVERWEREESEVALAVAETELRAAGDTKVVYSWKVGPIVDGIEEYAAKHGIDLVVIGSHGHGAVAGLVMGSVARECIGRLAVPVLVVPRIAVAAANLPSEEKALT